MDAEHPGWRDLTPDQEDAFIVRLAGVTGKGGCGMSTYELLAREQKASRLALALLDAKIPVEDVRRMDENDWAMAAERAKCKMPSPVTRGVVIQRLTEAQQHA